MKLLPRRGRRLRAASSSASASRCSSSRRRTAAASSASCSARLFVALGVGRLTCSQRSRRPLVARKLPRLPARARRAGALLGRVRRDRLVDLLRARHRRAARARADAARPARGRARSSCVVALSYAEGTAAIPETGGAATFVRRAFNDLARLRDRLGALPRLPDRDRALGALPAALPRRRARRRRRCATSPWDVVVAVCVIAAIAARPARAPARAPHRPALVVAVLDLVDAARCSSCSASRSSSRPTSLDARHRRSATRRRWRELAFALPLAMLAYTGLETVANLAEEAREPGRDAARAACSRRSGSSSSSPCDRRRRALGVPGRATARRALGERVAAGAAGRDRRPRSQARCRTRSATRCGSTSGSPARSILLAAATTSISGFSRLAHSLGEHGQLPRAFGRLNRRTLVSPQAIVAATGISIALARRHRRARRRRASCSRASTRSASCSRSRSPSSR